MSPFNRDTSAEEVTAGLDLRGKTALLTGSNSGIGLETLRVLVLRGARVLALARTREKAAQACASVMLKSVPGEALPFACEQTDYDSVVACADAVTALGYPLDMLIANAGLNVPQLEQVNGIEKHFAVHHLSHFILVDRLMPLIKVAPQGRIVLVSSIMYRDAPRMGIDFDNLSGERGRYRWQRMYGQSKLAQALFTRELSRRLASTRVTANVLHPGNVSDTHIAHVWNPENLGLTWRLFGKLIWPLWLLRHGGFHLKKTPAGAATTCYVATHPSLSGVSGAYFEDCQEVLPGGRMRDDRLAVVLWERSRELTRPYLLADRTTV